MKRVTMLPVLAALSFILLQAPVLGRAPAMQNQAPAVPAIVKDSAYPLRVQLAEIGASPVNARGGLGGYGHGNVLGPPAEGFDFTQECNVRFAPRPEGDQYFHARWKKQGQRLEVLIQEMGSDRIVQCELKIAMREQPYELSAPRVSPRTIARPAVPVTEPDPNFPLRLQLWVTSSGLSSMAGSHAEGYGNLIGPPAQGFDFANECPIRLGLGRNNTDVYQARWVEQGVQLEILVQEVGTRQESVCTLDVGMKSASYPVPAPMVRPRPPVSAPPVSAPRSPRPQAPASNSDLPPP